MAPRDTIEEIGEGARIYRAKQLGWSPAPPETPLDNWLAGGCAESAAVFSTALENMTNYDVEIIRGALDYHAEPTATTYEQALKEGTMHHWVQVTTDTETLICNLYSEALAENEVYPDGGLLITDTLPQNYIKFD